jgi:Transposase DDE domain
MTPEDYEKVPVTLEVRETRVGDWTLITSMTDEKYVSPLQLNGLYCMRWHIELDLRAIKSVLQMDMLRCKTPDMVVKEVAAHFLGYNLVRSVMAQAANNVNCMPRELSFKAALQQVRAFAEQLCCGIKSLSRNFSLALRFATITRKSNCDLACVSIQIITGSGLG